MAQQSETVRRLIATVPRISASLVYIPCQVCNAVVDIATAPIDAGLCAACAAAVAGLGRS